MKKAMERAREKIKSFREIEADIEHIEIRLEELEDEVLGIQGIELKERTSNTYKITSTVEMQFDDYNKKKDELIKEKKKLERELRKIKVAMKVLNEEERGIIKAVLIEKRRYCFIQEKYNCSYARVKQIEMNAFKKMKKYL
ncbi:sigma factor-like helix-turn-helix DNA-binding protein [uncultured Clostridium sp.]|uniref:sigma factor-like helix-turn-helix DNA-binding protein n=1 Tax=uncultured Clostridium sp. TaxID=59620 RepID=UPI0027321396|nr:sigma factor-like helix-turn-helix DNA-binding protein [uncultured Clostridium sp.]